MSPSTSSGSSPGACRRAERPNLSLEKADEYWDAACGLLNSITERDDRAASAYYNLACYEALRGEEEDALKHLGKAVQIYDTLRESAQANCDFDGIRSDPRFGQIVRELKKAA